MSDWPELTILLVTYDRPKEIRRTITALRERVIYPVPLRWHIADDHSPDDYLDSIQREFTDLHFSHSITDRKGWSANVNTALRAIKSSYIFLCEDDYVAKRPIDLRRGVALMEAMDTVGLVRYDGVSGHHLNLYLREVKDTKVGRLDFMLIEKKSPHLNVYSHRPHLKRHPQFHDSYGYYKEAQPGERHLGVSEVELAHRIKDKSGPALAILDDGVMRAFDHIGKSRQGTELDKVKK